MSVSVQEPEADKPPLIFISHRHSDQALAEKLVNLLTRALSLQRSDIRCTSVAGCKLHVGADAATSLGQDLQQVPVFICLLTPDSVESDYVLFELGAWWGLNGNEKIFPLLGPGISPSILPAPISGRNAASASKRQDVQQLLFEVARVLKVKLDQPHAYDDALDTLVTHPPAPPRAAAAPPPLSRKVAALRLGVTVLLSWLALGSGAAVVVKARPQLLAPEAAAPRQPVEDPRRAACQKESAEDCQATCEAGDLFSCMSLAEMLELGRGTARDEARAAALYERSCSGGFTRACTQLAQLYARGGVGKVDLTKAAELFGLGCKGGNADACRRLGGFFEEGRIGPVKDEARAAKFYEQGCEGGDAPSCASLGSLYERGRGVKEDAERAAALYAQACKGGEAVSCTRVGTLSELGQAGVTPEPQRAADFYAQGCQGGDARGCTLLGLLHAKGLGVSSTDPKRAVNFYAQGCQGGDAEGCTYLGLSYDNGMGVAQDTQKAIQFYEQACKANNPDGCMNLATLYQSGPGAFRNAKRATGFYHQACSLGVRKACARAL